MKNASLTEPVGRDEITKRLEAIQPGEMLKFQLSPTFGGMVVILELNPAFPKKGEKKYLLWLGKNEAHARKDKPYDASDKAKKLAGWVSERWPQWLKAEMPQEKAA